MSKLHTHSQEIKLKDNEIAAKINIEDGTIVPITPRKNNIPSDRLKWNNGNFKQPSVFGMDWAYNNLNDTQLRMVLRLIQLSGKDNTLRPLNDDVGIAVLQEYFQLSANTIKKNLDILFNKGVYGKFEVVDANKELTRYWLLNPYLSVSQGTVLNDVKGLFNNTEIAFYCRMRQELK